ncbi:hypothetical protein BDP55DRAFT_642979 [Colletotrichum godetiae]|uniref:Uncharacterized protein n=1 Tax=Colletotrichum godetiae TaxID=1209918 RepID=A0AAJ0B0Z4_9PEZI|nr:uncharacterized protein BDP55DRAFT_642979 [Colletotrichum godetiae]KAK1700448.1 hypothetical protein BDP55DRAFT_642979 [Colletotrichum godetiae]
MVRLLDMRPTGTGGCVGIQTFLFFLWTVTVFLSATLSPCLAKIASMTIFSSVLSIITLLLFPMGPGCLLGGLPWSRHMLLSDVSELRRFYVGLRLELGPGTGAEIVLASTDTCGCIHMYNVCRSEP